MDSLIRQARTDFPSLRQKKISPGKCSFRDTEFKCEWAFSGDAFAVSEAQAVRLAQCAAAAPTARPAKARSGASAFTMDPDLTVLVGEPQLDDGNWTVRLRIQTAYKRQ